MTPAEKACVEWFMDNVVHGVPGADSFNAVRSALVLERQSPECVDLLRPYRKALLKARMEWSSASATARETFGAEIAEASASVLYQEER